MQFSEGATVYTAGDDRVGTIERVVIDPKTKEVTHLVIEKGLLFTKDKVVPISLIGPATEEKVVLREDAGDLEQMPDFEEAHYVSAGTTALPATEPSPVVGSMIWYPPITGTLETDPRDDDMEKEYLKTTTQNIPEGTVALKEGAKVLSLDEKHVGDVERVFTSMPEEKVTHLLLSEGLIMKEKRLVPVNWISDVSESEVHLLVDSKVIENLPEYQA